MEISKLFEAIEKYENIDLQENLEYFNKTKIKIKNEFNDWIGIKGLIFKKDEIIKITTTGNNTFRIAKNHLLCYNNVDCIPAYLLNEGMEILKASNELVTIENIENQPIELVYDIEVDSDTHLYQTSDGFVHHNTLLSVQIALDAVFKKEKSKIIITRPTVSNEDNGFLPGTLQEKLEPWMVPIKDNMRKVYNKPEKLKDMEVKGEIELVSISHFRGRTFDDAVCIIDEFQNLTKSQLEMCIGRLGKNSIMIFCGDNRQIDLKNKVDSAVLCIEKFNECKHVFIASFKENHRHPAINEILACLNDAG